MKKMSASLAVSLAALVCALAVTTLLPGSQANAQQTATTGGQLTESEIQESRIYREPLCRSGYRE